MSVRIENGRGSNHSVFLPQNYGSPFNDTAEHISDLGLRRLDFERFAVAGEVIYSVEGDSTPTSQQDEEARIATLAHTLKKLSNREDAAEFMRCLNAICAEGDARYRQVAASYYYGEITERGAGPVLKEMALLAMQLASLNPITEEGESDSEAVYALAGESRPKSLFDQEVASVERMIRGRRKSAGLVHDQWTEWLNDLEASGATVDELDDAFRHVEALDQYDEGGAIIRMSAHERTIFCGRVDPEFTEEDLPKAARHLAGCLRFAYVDGVDIEKMWDEIDAQLRTIFPVSLVLDGPEGARRTNLTTGLPDYRLTRQEVKVMDPATAEVECEGLWWDVHMTALRHNDSYRRFFMGIRSATDTGRIGEVMTQARQAHRSGDISAEQLWRLQHEKDNQIHRLLRSNVMIYGQPSFISHANRRLQKFTRQVLESILNECEHDLHMTAMRRSPAYQHFYWKVREADDTKIVGQAMKEAYAAKESGELSLKHFTLLKTASALQRERLERAPLSKEARALIREVETATPGKLRYLSWAFYGENQPDHPIHSLPAQMISRIWSVLKIRKLEMSGLAGQTSRQWVVRAATAKRRVVGGARALHATV